MPIDTSIYSNIKPVEMPDMLGTAAKFATLSHLNNQVEKDNLENKAAYQSKVLSTSIPKMMYLESLPEDQRASQYDSVMKQLASQDVPMNNVPQDAQGNFVYDPDHFSASLGAIKSTPEFQAIAKPKAEIAKLDSETKYSNEIRDPNSAASKRMQGLGVSLGLKGDLSGFSAEELQKIAPLSEKARESDVRSSEISANNLLKREAVATSKQNRQDALTDKWTKSLKDDLDANKGRSGNFGAISGKIQSAERLEALADAFKNGSMAAPQVEEMALGMANMISGSSGVARSQVEALVPHSAIGDTNKFLSWIQNDPRGANQQKFIDMMSHTIAREKEVANGQLNQIRVQRLGAHEQLRKNAPAAYAKVLEGYGLDPSGKVIQTQQPEDPSAPQPRMTEMDFIKNYLAQKKAGSTNAK